MSTASKLTIVNLDAGKFSFGNRVCVEWNKLPGWVINVENMNNFKGNLDHYLRDIGPLGD